MQSRAASKGQPTDSFEEHMALIPPFMMDCVVAIGFRDKGGKVGYAGTGFLHAQLIDATQPEKRYVTFLATNRHVLEGESTAVLRFNPTAPSPAKEYDVGLNDGQGKRVWEPHRDPDIDVAVMPVNPNVLTQEGIQYAVFVSDQHLLTHLDAAQQGLSEGDGIFVLGFPLGNTGAERNYVVIRQGCIARIRDSLAGAVKTFYIDAGVFPGNSGGPVITRPEAMGITGTKRIQRAAVIGMVSGYLPYQDVAVSQQTRRPRIIFEENTGLATVIPIDRVMEVCADVISARSGTGSAPAAGPQPPSGPSPTP
jgi:S1-C subfamily serine protease